MLVVALIVLSCDPISDLVFRFKLIFERPHVQLHYPNLCRSCGCKTSSKHEPATTFYSHLLKSIFLLNVQWYGWAVLLWSSLPRHHRRDIIWLPHVQVSRHNLCYHELFKNERLSPGNQTVLLFSEHCTYWPKGEFTGKPTPGKIGNWMFSTCD